jgi:hypothetical protein
MNYLSWILGTLILWVLKALGTMPLAKLFARMSQPAPAVPTEIEYVPVETAETQEAPAEGIEDQEAPAEETAGQAVPTTVAPEIPVGSYILADVLVMSVAGFLLGVITGSFFIGISWKVRAWPGMIVFILGSLLGSALR